MPQAAGDPVGNDVSSYLQYLPPVLWAPPATGAADTTTPDPGLELGAFLRIFEEVATGLGDEIADGHRLFDPWTTPARFLPWLASWVALEFPTLQGNPLWQEYQQRKVTAEIAQIYRLRGRRTGLNKYLDLYAVGPARPRVSVDDGGRLLSVVPRPGALAEVSALVSQGPVVQGTQVRSEGLTRPWGVDADDDGSLGVGDIGRPETAAVRLPSRAWHLDAAGRYELAGIPPRPAPLAADLATLKDVVAVAVRPPRAAAPATLYVLTRTGRLFAVPAPYRGVPATLVTTLSVVGTPVWMVALAVDPATGDLLALDRGGSPQQAAAPAVVTVRPDPLVVTRTRLTTVLEPLCVTVEPGGGLLIGDGREQEPADATQFPANLVRVDRGPTPWTETLLLPADAAANPLVAPTGLARLDGRLYVLDVGLKPLSPSATDPFICPVAEPAALYEVDLGPQPPSLSRVTAPGEFVYPTGLAATAEQLVVADPGQPEVSALEPYWARVRPFQFDVAIHFTDSRLPAEPADRKRVLDQAVGNISAIVTEQKPAHTLWTLTTSIL